MSMFSRIGLALLLAALTGAAFAKGLSMTPQVGGGIGQFDGGISSVLTAAAPPPSCTTDGSLDLSQCSNAIYLALII